MSSIELLQNNQSVMLTNVIHRRPAKLDIDAPDGPTQHKREALKKLTRSRPSSQFLDSGYHYVMHDFPWKRDELMAEVMGDLTDGGGLEEPNLFSPMSHHRESRLASDGSEDVFEPDPLSLSEMQCHMIDMEEDRNEEQRRLQANYKWNLRRQKIENEFLRLRHLSINRSRAAGGKRLRHSVSFGDDLEIQLEQSRMRDLENGLEGDKKTTSMDIPTMRINPAGKSYQRTMSMPSKDFDEHLTRATFPRHKVPSLETHREFVEEEEEEEEEGELEEEEEVDGEAGMLGLPPKDIPNISMEQLDWNEETDIDEID